MKKFVLFLLLIAFVASVYAETCSPDGYCFDCYDSSQSLPQNQIVAFSKDSSGYMFVAGRNFLARFDGSEFVFPEGGRLDGMPTSTINDFVIGGDGIGYIATDLGLWKVNLENFERSSFKNVVTVGNVGNLSVISLTYDRNKSLLYGAAEGKGVFSLSSNGGVEWFSPENSRLDTRNVEKVFADSHGTIWLGTENGVWFLKDGSEKFVQIDYLDDSVAAFSEEAENKIYAGGKNGIYVIENGEVATTFSGEKFNSLDITALIGDGTGTIWVGTENSGFFIFDENGGLDIDSVKNITAFIRDNEGEIWFGTLTDGFCIAKRTALTNMFLNDENISGVVSDSSGNIFVNTTKEIVRLGSGGEREILGKSGFNSIFIDKTGLLWASGPSGLSVMQPDKSFKPVKEIYSSEDDLFPVSSDIFFSDEDGNVWVNDLYMDGALFIFRNDRTAERFMLPDADAEVVDIIRLEGKPFVVTKRSGVFALEENNTFVPATLWEKDIFAKRVFVDSKQRIWILTLSDEIFINIEKDAIAFPAALIGNGVPLHSVAEDKNGNFWIMTDAGVARINGEDTDCFVSGKCSRVPMVFYGKKDGMVFWECAEGRSADAAVSADGFLFVPMMKGVAVFDTNFKENSSFVPEIKIDRILADGKEINSYHGDNFEKIVLPHSVKMLEIFYSVPFFADSGELLFDYSFDKEQTVGTTSRKSTFFNVSGGLHEFSVKVYHSAATGNFSEKKIKIEVPAEFYEKKGFVAAVPVLLLLLFSIFVFLNKRLKAMRDAEVKRLISEKTAELQMKNNTLKEAVMKDPLTGLMNRRYMFEVEERKIRRFIESRERKIHLIDNRNLLEIEKNNDSVYGVIMMDIDHFKRVNDRYGHDAGDVVLKGIAEIMQDSVRADDILIRWGGEEFLIVLKNIPMRKLFEVAKKIRKAIEMHPFDTQNGSTVWVTASMGVVFLPFFSLEPKLLTFENVITIADMALYYSKENGRDMATFVAPGKNIPETADDINGMLGSSEFAEVNGFYTFEKIEPDNFSEFEI